MMPVIRIREKIDQVKSFLPDDASDPIVIKFDPSLMPILVLGMDSEEKDLQKLQEYAEDIITDADFGFGNGFRGERFTKITGICGRYN